LWRRGGAYHVLDELCHAVLHLRLLTRRFIHALLLQHLVVLALGHAAVAVADVAESGADRLAALQALGEQCGGGGRLDDAGRSRSGSAGLLGVAEVLALGLGILVGGDLRLGLTGGGEGELCIWLAEAREVGDWAVKACAE
jgi:hypothetical protein